MNHVALQGIGRVFAPANSIVFKRPQDPSLKANAWEIIVQEGNHDALDTYYRLGSRTRVPLNGEKTVTSQPKHHGTTVQYILPASTSAQTLIVLLNIITKNPKVEPN